MMSFSTRAGAARPVRTLANSWREWLTAFAILSLASSRTIEIMSSSLMSRTLSPPLPHASVDQSANGCTFDDRTDVALAEQVEHHDREVVVHAQRDGGG